MKIQKFKSVNWIFTARLISTNFNTIHCILLYFQIPVIEVLDAMFFIEDLITCAAAPPD